MFVIVPITSEFECRNKISRPTVGLFICYHLVVVVRKCTLEFLNNSSDILKWSLCQSRKLFVPIGSAHFCVPFRLRCTSSADNILFQNNPPSVYYYVRSCLFIFYFDKQSTQAHITNCLKKKILLIYLRSSPRVRLSAITICLKRTIDIKFEGKKGREILHRYIHKVRNKQTYKSIHLYFGSREWDSEMWKCGGGRESETGRYWEALWVRIRVETNMYVIY